MRDKVPRHSANCNGSSQKYVLAEARKRVAAIAPLAARATARPWNADATGTEEGENMEEEEDDDDDVVEDKGGRDRMRRKAWMPDNGGWRGKMGERMETG